MGVKGWGCVCGMCIRAWINLMAFNCLIKIYDYCMQRVFAKIAPQ